MKKINVLLSLFIIVVIIIISSCNNNEKIITSPTSNIIKDNVQDESCYDEYIANNGTCTSRSYHYVEIWKDGVKRNTCNGTLRIEGYTCTNQYFLCILPLSQTMICVYHDNTGPLVPFGNYTYSVCCDLGAGQVSVTVPTSGAQINLNMGCDYNIERQND